MVIQYTNVLQIWKKRQLLNYKVMCIKDTNHRKILLSNASSNCIQHFKPRFPSLYFNNPGIFKGLYNCVTIVYNLTKYLIVWFILLASKLYNYAISFIHITGTTTPWQAKNSRYALWKVTHNLFKVNFLYPVHR